MALNKALLILGLCIVVTGQVRGALAQFDGPADPRASQMFSQERSANVGDTLPTGIEVLNRKGKTVDLREVLRGPVILFKISSSCEPCDLILAMLRQSEGSDPDTPKATLAVLRVGDKSYASMELPQEILEFRTASALEDGFLGGRITPTTFYFDIDLKLVKRFPGQPMDAKNLLRFPARP